MGAFTLKAGYGTSKVDGAAASTKKLGLGVDYALREILQNPSQGMADVSPVRHTQRP
jgi:hypothetical protein